jgi:hypothetical protein
MHVLHNQTQSRNHLMQQTAAHSICEMFADLYELPVDYVWAEFANPEVDGLEAVTQALDVAALLVYD